MSEIKKKKTARRSGGGGGDGADADDSKKSTKKTRIEPAQEQAEEESNKSNGKVTSAPPLGDKFDMTMLECLSGLTSFDRALRMHAAKSLVEQLMLAQGDAKEPCEDLALIVDRLTFGLTSGREGSRQGFSVVLTQLLQSFPSVLPSKVLAVVEEKMDATGEKGDVEKQIYFGRIFAVACIMRSGRLDSLSTDERESTIKHCLAILVALYEKKSYMKELVAHTIVELLALLRTERELREIALPALAGFLSVSPDECSPEVLALLLSLKDGASTFNSEWTEGVPVLLQSDHIKPALLASSYTHPRVHFVWKIILDSVFASSKPDLRRSVWTLVDTILFGSHVDNRKYLAFSLLIEFVQRASSADDVVFFVASPNTTRALTNHLAASRVTKMSDVASRVIEQIKEKVVLTPSLGLALLQTRFLAPINMDLQLVATLPTETGIKYLSGLLENFNKEQGERVVSAVKRAWKKWCAGAAGEGNSGDKLASKAKEIVQVFAKLAFLSEVEADRQWGKMRLFTVLSELEVTGHANLIELCQWLQPQMKDLDTKVVKMMQKAFRCVAAFPQNSGRYENAFLKVIGLASLNSLHREDDDEGGAVDDAAMAVWEDALLSSAKFISAVADNDVKERNKSVLVLVSLMIEFLTVSSALNRVVVVNAFRQIAPMIPERGLKDIVVAVLSTDDDEEEEGDAEAEDLLDEDDEDDEEEHFGHDEGHKHGENGHHHHDEHRGPEDDEDIEAGNFLPDIMLDDADPEYLSRVEESLGNIFRALKEKKTGAAKKANSALDFKLRVLDLLENFVHSLSRMASMESLPFSNRNEGDNRSIVFTMLPQILAKLKKTQHSVGLKPLNDKLRRVVLKDICEIREWPSMEGHGRVLIRALKAVLDFASKGNPTQEFAALIERAAVVLVKVLSRDHLMDAGVSRTLFMSVVRYCCTRKNLRFLTMEKFFVPMWKRIPETAVALFPHIAEAAGSKEWTQKARLSTVLALVEFVMRSGKSFLIQNPSFVLPSIHSLERVFLAWLRSENGKTKGSTVTQIVSQVRGALAGVLTDMRLGRMEKSQVYSALPLRIETAQAVESLQSKHYAQQNKLAGEVAKLLKLLGPRKA